MKQRRNPNETRVRNRLWPLSIRVLSVGADKPGAVLMDDIDRITAAIFVLLLLATLVVGYLVFGPPLSDYKVEQEAHRDLCELAGGVYERPQGWEECWSLEKGTRLFPWLVK